MVSYRFNDYFNILPGITATVSASTRENTISQNSDISQSENNEGIDTDQDKDVEKS